LPKDLTKKAAELSSSEILKHVRVKYEDTLFKSASPQVCSTSNTKTITNPVRLERKNPYFNLGLFA